MTDRPATAPLAAERHPHLGDELPDGWVRVDCHSHTMWSGDSTTTPEELIGAVEETAIDVLCITDHNAVAGAFELMDRLACRVVVGEEIRVGAGELIGLFLNERIPTGLNPIDTARAIRAQGGLVYVPHPFDPMRNALPATQIDALVAEGLVDGIEGWNAKTSLRSLNLQAQEYGERHGLFLGAGSDAHVPRALGAAYLEMPDFDGPDGFLRSVKQARIVGHHFDEPRPWSPRIVPSTKAQRPTS